MSVENRDKDKVEKLISDVDKQERVVQLWHEVAYKLSDEDKKLVRDKSEELFNLCERLGIEACFHANLSLDPTFKDGKKDGANIDKAIWKVFGNGERTEKLKELSELINQCHLDHPMRLSVDGAIMADEGVGPFLFKKLMGAKIGSLMDKLGKELDEE